MSTTVHELGHGLEDHNPRVRREAQDFLQERTRGESWELLSKLTGHRGYRIDERAKPDRFFDKYCGKIYSSGHTEIVSMGLQHMVENPTKFAEQDPEYFKLVVGWMHGTPKKAR